MVLKLNDEFTSEIEISLFTCVAGGQSSLADYCTYFVAYSDGSCTDTSSARAPDRMLGEVRGSNSRSDFFKFIMWYVFTCNLI